MEALKSLGRLNGCGVLQYIPFAAKAARNEQAYAEIPDMNSTGASIGSPFSSLAADTSIVATILAVRRKILESAKYFPGQILSYTPSALYRRARGNQCLTYDQSRTRTVLGLGRLRYPYIVRD